VSLALRCAAVLYAALGIGFGAGAVVTADHLARTGELPMTPFGFRSMSGPFEALGQGPFTVLAWSLAAVCALDALAGAWLWQGRRRGARLGLASTPAALVLGAGFALPFLLLGVPARVALIVAGRRGLR
jgi:hypothetical protein